MILYFLISLLKILMFFFYSTSAPPAPIEPIRREIYTVEQQSMFNNHQHNTAQHSDQIESKLLLIFIRLE